MTNDLMISTLWETYKKQVWWKKVITFLPFVLLLVVFIVIYVAIKRGPEATATFDNSEAKVEEAIEVGKDNLGKLEKEKIKLEKKKDNIVEEHKKDEENISGANNDFNELTNIAKDISSRVRSRE